MHRLCFNLNIVIVEDTLQKLSDPPTRVVNMAMMDDPVFLISHIRNSFITSDDTGMCEIIIENDEYEKDKRKTNR